MWAAATLAMAALLVAGLKWSPLAHPVWVAPVGLFWFVTVGAGLCWVGGLLVLRAGWRDQLAEVAILGAVIMVASIVALVHGLTAPRVLYGPTSAVSTSILLANPLAMAAGVPLIAPKLRFSMWAARHVRPWTVAWVAASATVAAALLIAPNALPAAAGGTVPALTIALPAVVAALAISLRELRLYWVGRKKAYLVASIGIAAVGLSGLVWLGDTAFSAAWWAAHALDVGGVLAGAGAILAGYHADRSLSKSIAPILSRDPVIALELGLSPIIHGFVAALATKDAITRDHVVRVAELAMRTGERLGFRGSRLRYLGLAALLHDIGKLDVPAAILTKPGPLSPAEIERMRVHTVVGWEILSTSPLLAPAARLVRAHHERVDGTGYPDGLKEGEIPFDAAIIAACDAYDAMAHTRHYRTALEPEQAIAILREHAGTQWLPKAVDAVILVLSDGLGGQALLDNVGRGEFEHTQALGADICLDAMPVATQQALA